VGPKLVLGALALSLLTAAVVFAAPSASQPLALRYLCARDGDGLLRYVPNANGCGPPNEALLDLSSQAPIYACVSRRPRTVTDPAGREIVIPKGTAWHVDASARCLAGQLRLTLPGSAPVYFCAHEGYRLLRYVGRPADCRRHEIALVVPRSSSKAPHPLLPTADPQSLATDEDAPLAIVLSGSSDPPGEPLTYAIATPPAQGTLSGTPPSVTYTPHSGYHGTDHFTFTVTDHKQTSAPANVTIVVNHLDVAPVDTVPAAQTVAENATLVFSGAHANEISVSDVDSEGGVEQVKLTVAHGTLELGATSGLQSSAGNQTREVTVRGSIVALDAALAGLVYTPADDYHGADTLTLETDDLGQTGVGGPKTTTSTVGITVGQVDVAPVDTVPGAQTLAENATLVFSGAHANEISVGDVDSEGGVEQVELTVAHGTLTPGSTAGLTVSGDGTDELTLEGTIAALDGALEGLTYVPAHDFHAADTLTATADDLGHTGAGGPLTTTSTVGITVSTAVYDHASDDSYSTNENEALAVSAPGVLANDTDSDSLPLSAVLVTGPAHGTLTLNANGSFTYTPEHDFAGTDSFTYSDNDGNTASDTATVTLTVDRVTYDTAVDDSYTVDEDATLTVAAPGVLANDTDTDSPALPLSAVLVEGPKHGTLTLEADGSFVYVPTADFSGSDSFTYKDDDGNAASSTATVSIAVEHVNRAPVNTVPMPGQTTSENTSLVFSTADANAISVSDVDSEGGVEQVELTVAHGTLTPGSTAGLIVSGDGTDELTLEGTIAALSTGLEGLAYAPETDYHGADTLTLTTDDLGHTGVGGAKTTTSTVGITVSAAVYDHASDDSYSINENEALAVSAPGVLANDTDSDSLPLSAVLVTGPAYGTLTLNADGSFTYTPEALYSGTDSFTYEDNDGNTDSNTATVTITVAKATFDHAADDSYSVDENATLTKPAAEGVLANDSDSEGLPLTAELVTGPEHGTLTLEGDGSFVYQPDAGFSGTDTFTYQDNDGNTPSNQATATISVEHVDRAPTIAVPLGEQEVDSGAALVFSGANGNAVSVGDVDSDGAVEEVKLSAAHGTLTPATTSGLESHAGDGTGDLTLKGTIMALNEALEGLTYTAQANYGGTDTLTLAMSDLGHSGLGGPKTATGTVAIKIVHTNEAPVNTVPGKQETEEGTALVFSKGNGNGVSVADVDSDGGVERVKLTVAHGTLAPGAGSGLIVAGGGTGELTLEGTITALDEGLGGLTYTPAGGYSGTDTLTLETDDLGHTGAGGPRTATSTVEIAVVNPPPVPLDPTYSGAIGNTELSVGVAAGGAPDVERSGSVLPSPAEEPNGSTLSVTKETITTAKGGTVSMNANGTFTYQPPVGVDNGTDTFSYTENDSRGTHATGTVTIKIDNARAWYVNDTLGSNGDGASNSPFNALSSVGGASSSGDVVFLYGGGASYAGGIALKSNQTLDGQDEGLTVEGEQLVSASGGNPTVTDSSGAGITLAEGASVKGVTVSGTTGPGIKASGVGAFQLDSKVVISGAGGDGLEISGGSGTVSDGASITSSSSAHSLVVQSRTGGTVTVSGPVTDTGTGLLLSSNSGATINFTGKLSLSTGANQAFSATGGGTVSATNGEDTASTTTATALEVANTTIGAAGLTFKSISAGTGASGPSRGISLVSTGTTGGLTITGSGTTAGSGGTIEHTTASDSATFGEGGGGVYLDATSDVSLANMDIADNHANGIYGTDVSGFTITGSSVTDNGTELSSDDSGIRFDGLDGTASIATSTVSGSPDNNATITSQSTGTLGLTVTGSTFGPKVASTAGDGLRVEDEGTAVTTLGVSGSTFTGNYADGLQTLDEGSGSMKVTAEHDTLTNNTGTGVNIDGGSSAPVTFLVHEDKLTGQQGNAINLFASGSGTMVGHVTDDEVGSATADSGSSAGSGIALTSGGSETMTAEVGDNTVKQIKSEDGINAAAEEGSAVLNLTLLGNHVETSQVTSQEGIYVDSGALPSDTSTVCLDAKGNTATTAGTEAGNGRFNGAGLAVIQNTPSAHFEIQGLSKDTTDTEEVQKFLEHENTLSGAEGGAYAQLNTGEFVTATCPTAP
jgi:VCBS repeat-containing protein